MVSIIRSPGELQREQEPPVASREGLLAEGKGPKGVIQVGVEGEGCGK